ncbi:MAG: zinc finger-like domain-containing protein [Victivallaceae bacterium]
MKFNAVVAAAVIMLALAGCGKPQVPSAESLRLAAEKAAADYLPSLLNNESANNPGNRIYRVSGNEIAIASSGVRVETQIPAATSDSELIGFTLARRYSFAKTSFTLKNIAYGPIFEKTDRYFCQLRFLYQKQFILIPEYTGVTITGVRPPDRLFATPEAKNKYFESYDAMLPADSVEHRRMIDRFSCTETLIESVGVLAAYQPEEKRWTFSVGQTELRRDPRVNGERPDPTLYDPAQFTVEVHGRQVAFKDAENFRMLVAGAIALGGQWRQVTQVNSSSPVVAATSSAPVAAEQRAAASPVTGAELKTPPRISALAVFQSASSLPVAERVDAFLKVVPDDPTLSARHWHMVFQAVLNEAKPPAITEMVPKVEPVLLDWIKNGKDVDVRMITTMGRSHPAWLPFCTGPVLAAAANRRQADPGYVSPVPTYSRSATRDPGSSRNTPAPVQLTPAPPARNPKIEMLNQLTALFPPGGAVPAEAPAEVRLLLRYANAPELDSELKTALAVTAMLYACRINDETTVRACRKNSPGAQSVYATLGPPCGSCRGIGFRGCPVCRDGSCRGCGGQGWIERTEQEIGGAVKRRYTCTLCNSSGKCAKCEGKGNIDCPACNGKGHLRTAARIGDALPRAVEKLRERLAAESSPPETAR